MPGSDALRSSRKKSMRHPFAVPSVAAVPSSGFTEMSWLTKNILLLIAVETEIILPHSTLWAWKARDRIPQK